MTEPSLEKSKQLGESFRQSRKELWVMLGAWVVFFAWTVGYCSQNAFADPNGEEARILFGIPRWVLFGIALPWLVANGFIIWFAACFMKDTPLGDESAEEVMSDQ